ncbi:unnamed protein product, partial [Tetraodon nigroviridis]
NKAADADVQLAVSRTLGLYSDGDPCRGRWSVLPQLQHAVDHEHPFPGCSLHHLRTDAGAAEPPQTLPSGQPHHFRRGGGSRLRRRSPRRSTSVRRSLNTQENVALTSVNISGHLTGMANAFRTVYRLGGLAAFFKGVQARVIYQMPSTAIAWSVYEFFKYFLTKQQNQNS